jgi:hypothetical protein
MSSSLAQHTPVTATHHSAAAGVAAARRAVAPRALATLLLAAGVAALAVVADRMMDTWAEQHLLLAWTLMWGVVFVGSLLLASPARHAAQRLMDALNAWALRRALARAEARTQAFAQRDARLQAELRALQSRADDWDAEAWDRALSPLAPAPSGSGAGTALQAWVWSELEQAGCGLPAGRRYSLYYV